MCSCMCAATHAMMYERCDSVCVGKQSTARSLNFTSVLSINSRLEASHKFWLEQ